MTIVRIDGKEDAPDITKLILREQLAAQMLAVARAHFTRPDFNELREIIRCLEGQIEALRQMNGDHQ